VIYEEEPVYPVSARYARHEGSGTFWIHIDPSGRVNAVKIVESTRYKDLDNAAVYALYRWRFKPGKTAQALVPITFSLTTHSIGVHRY
jgi:protein TonB